MHNKKPLNQTVLVFLLMILISSGLSAQSFEADSAKASRGAPDNNAFYYKGLDTLNILFSKSFQFPNYFVWGNTKTARVILEFNIEDNGEITDLGVIKNTMYLGNTPVVLLQLNNEIKTIIQGTSGDWVPARKKKEFVRQKYRMTILFKNISLEDGFDSEQILPIWPVSAFEPIEKNRIYSMYSVEKVPSYKLGPEALYKLLHDSVILFSVKVPKKLNGYTDVEFVISKDGSIKDFKILAHHKVPSKHLINSRLLIEKTSGRWTSASINGTRVPCMVRYRIFYQNPLREKEILQSNTTLHTESIAPYSKHDAKFIGSKADFEALIRKNLLYTSESIKHCINTNLKVYATIELDGSISSVKIKNEDSIGYGLEQPGLDALSKTEGRWIPAYHKNHYQRSEQVVLIPFKVAPHPAPDPANSQSKEPIFNAFEVDKEATYKSGIKAFYEYFSYNYKFPSSMYMTDFSKKAMVSFVVEKDGSLSNIKLLNESLKYFCFEESIQIFLQKTKGDWSPAKKKGFAVRSKIVMPLYFE